MAGATATADVKAAQREAVVLADPAGIDDIARRGGYDALIAMARGNPNRPVYEALAERLHGRSPRFFYPAACAARRGQIQDVALHFDRVLGAPDREGPIGRRRIESACRSFEGDPRTLHLFHARLANEVSPGVAKELFWSLVHAARAHPRTIEAILDTVKRFPAQKTLRSEAARALSYCQAPERAALLRAFLDEHGPEDRRKLGAFARLAK